MFKGWTLTGRSVGLTSTGGLTPTERRMLELRASGLTRTEIASLLHRSPQTISNSLTIAKEKLGARSLVEAAALVSNLGPAANHLSSEPVLIPPLPMNPSGATQRH
jgi:DNA-binding CsgD family transcriptional regulator